MKCSKCWMREKACLDTDHRSNSAEHVSLGVKGADRQCRAMRAVLKLAQVAIKESANCGKRKCLSDSSCLECWASWATK
jgi:hypothetical protein